jgi:copper chaperone
MTQTTINVPEIHCMHCKMSIEGAVAGVAGVETVTVDVPTAKVDVSFDTPATMDAIVAAIEGQGYEVPRST